MTQGIWLPIFIHGYSNLRINYISPQIFDNKDSFLVSVNIYTQTARSIHSATITASVTQVTNSVIGPLKFSDEEIISISLQVPKKDVQLWWPNGYGNLKMTKFFSNLFLNK